MLPLLIYTAAKAYRSKENKKAQELAVERQNTVYDYGYALDDLGNPTGSMRLRTPDDTDWQSKYIRLGEDGQPQAVTPTTSIEAAFTDLNSKITGRKADFYNVDGTVKDGMKPVQTGQYVGNEFKSYPTAILNQLFEEDKEDDSIAVESPVGYILRADETQVFPNTQKAIEYAENNDLPSDMYYRTATETKKGNVTTKFEFGDTDISLAADAANKVDKPAIFEIRYTDPKKEPFTFRPIGTTETITENTLSRLDTDIGRLGIKNINDIQAFDQDSYVDFLASVAGSFMTAFTDVDKDGVKMGVNHRLYQDVPTLLQNEYRNLRDLPGFSTALQNAVDGRRDNDLSLIIKKLKDEGKSPSITTMNNSDDPNIPPGVNIDIVLGENPTEKTILDATRAYLTSDAIGLDPNGAQKFVTNVLTVFKPGTSGTEKAEVQPKINFIGSLMQRKIAGTQTTLFDRFLELTSQYDNIYTQKDQELLSEFTSVFGTFEEQVAFVEAINPKFRGNNAQRYHFKAYTNNTGSLGQLDDFVEENRAVAKGYGNAERFLTGAASTYTMDDGSPLNIGSKQGEIALTLDGALFIYDEFVRGSLEDLPIVGNMFKNATVVGGTLDQKFNAINDAVFSRSDNIERFSDLSTPEKQAYLDERGITTPIAQYEADERAASNELRQEFEALSRGATKRDRNGQLIQDEKAEINLKLAMRAYYRYMAAYALASATQGGTGGRTISDQDVLNFLRAFQSEKLLSNPATERGVLESILREVKAQKKIAETLATGGSVTAAALKVLKMPGSEFIGMDINKLGRNVGVKGTGTASSATEKPEVPAGPTSIQILERINQYQRENGDPLIDVPADEGAAKLIVDSLKDNPFYLDSLAELNEELRAN